MSSRGNKLVFALAWQKNSGPVGENLAAFFAWLSQKTGIRVTTRAALSYQELAEMMRAGGGDLAWLPPIVYAKLEREKVATALVSHERAAIARYESVLVVRRKSPIRELEDLRDTRVGWVDRWSAAGYVLPALRSSRAVWIRAGSSAKKNSTARTTPRFARFSESKPTPSRRTLARTLMENFRSEDGPTSKAPRSSCASSSRSDRSPPT